MMKMKAAVFVEPGRTVLDEKPIPDIASSWTKSRRPMISSVISGMEY
jgi:hypothetical protein